MEKLMPLFEAFMARRRENKKPVSQIIREFEARRAAESAHDVQQRFHKSRSGSTLRTSSKDDDYARQRHDRDKQAGDTARNHSATANWYSPG